MSRLLLALRYRRRPTFAFSAQLPSAPISEFLADIMLPDGTTVTKAIAEASDRAHRRSMAEACRRCGHERRAHGMGACAMPHQVGGTWQDCRCPEFAP